VARGPRAFLDGGFYHVYCRVSRGERVFADPEEAARFVGVVADVKRRDGLSVLAWCVMANHYHLAVRTAAVPLWRSIRLIQWRFACQLNRRRKQLGPLWQGRYQAKLVEDSRYLYQLIAYIHLNPVAAGLVGDPADYRWSGHGELVRRASSPLVDANVTLALFGSDRAKARREYVRVLRGERESKWVGERPGRLPWWGRRDADEDLDVAWESALTETPAPRPAPFRDVGRYLDVAAEALGIELRDFGGRGKLPPVVRAREAMAIVGVERFGVKLKALAEALGINAGSVSRWVVRAAARRSAEEGFARRCAELEVAVNESVKKPRG
jgi:putative transposase